MVPDLKRVSRWERLVASPLRAVLEPENPKHKIMKSSLAASRDPSAHGPAGPRTQPQRTSMLLTCWRIWHCWPSLPAALRSFSSMAESIPPATLVQKASEPLMNSLEMGKGWVDGHESSTLPCVTPNPTLAPRRQGIPALLPSRCHTQRWLDFQAKFAI